VALEETGLRLTGGKRWIVNATIADYAVVLARHRPGPHFTSFTQVLVPTCAPAVQAEPASTVLLAGSRVGHLRFSGVRLGRDHIIGRTGQGLAAFADQAATERMAGALWANALARRVLTGTYQHLTRRILGGRPLWDNDAVRQRFAGSLLEQQRLQALCRQPCPPGASRSRQLLGGMLVKAAAATSLEAILAGCAQLAGAEGFRDDGIQLLRAEAAMFGIAGGTTETMLAGLADHADDLLGAP
jgi:citronellyl-CoA dehydrogenase